MNTPVAFPLPNGKKTGALFHARLICSQCVGEITKATNEFHSWTLYSNQPKKSSHPFHQPCPLANLCGVARRPHFTTQKKKIPWVLGSEIRSLSKCVSFPLVQKTESFNLNWTLISQATHVSSRLYDCAFQNHCDPLF
jgi:hypothetical protein